jgi:hypothetical protein
MHTVGARRQLAPLLRASCARAEPTARAISGSNDAAMLVAAGKHAALVLPLRSSPRVPLGPSVVCRRKHVSASQSRFLAWDDLMPVVPLWMVCPSREWQQSPRSCYQLEERSYVTISLNPFRFAGVDIPFPLASETAERHLYQLRRPCR